MESTDEGDTVEGSPEETNPAFQPYDLIGGTSPSNDDEIKTPHIYYERKLSPTLANNDTAENENQNCSERNTKQDLIGAVGKLISYESLTNTIDSPMKTLCSDMGCDTPVQTLLQSFSPSLSKYMNPDESEQNYHFMQNINLSPNQYNSFINPLSNHSFPCMLPSSTFEHTEHKVTTPLYPGSMLTGPTADMISSAQIESYLNGENASMEAFQNYSEEILNTSEQPWPPMNTMMGDSMLPPVMLSSYDEMALLQQELQANNCLNQYVLPVYFQPVMLPENEKRKYKRRNRKRKHMEVELEENVRNLLALKEGDGKDEPERKWLKEIHPTDDELLHRCQEAVNTEEVSDIKPVTNGDSMKYLEQAALKLLKSSENSPSEQTITKFRCHICLRYFKRLYTLETHVRVHNGSKPFICEYCGQGFRQSGTKLNHVRAVHSKEKPFKCSYCVKKFSHKSSLVVHERIHTKEKPFECETCGKRFTDRATYQKHKPIHTGIKPHSCPICPKKFSQKSNLKRHFHNIHKNKNFSEYR